MYNATKHFYPRSPCGERRGTLSDTSDVTANFYPRSPCGERPPKVLRHCTTYLFLSTLSLRRATKTRSQPGKPRALFLSTLSLRRATLFGVIHMEKIAFLSTLSLRRATSPRSISSMTHTHFYPRSPCGERPLLCRILFRR